MADLLAAYDWVRSPLGPREHWPEALKIAVQIVMNSRFPMFIWWGRQLISIYNDGYVPMLGKKHPASFAQPASEVWRENWDVVGPQTDLVIQHHRSTWNEEMLLVMERHDYVEETYFTFSYSPVGGDSGHADGLLCAVTEDTSKVIGRRRLKTLRELAMDTADMRTASKVFAAAAAVIDRNPHDIPFALLYELDREGKSATLTGVAGAGTANIGAPARVGLGTGENPWGLNLDSGECQLIGNLENCLPKCRRVRGRKARVEEASHMLAVSEDEQAIASETPHTGKELPRLLIADDNSDMRGYLERLFSKDFEVEMAADGVAALEAAKRSLPALVLTDVMMRRLDGFGLLRALRADARTHAIPVILLTARAGEEERIEGLGTGAHEYVTKPFGGRELLARVKAAIALYRVKGA
jgi:CheY-like chemotaxis protein